MSSRQDHSGSVVSERPERQGGDNKLQGTVDHSVLMDIDSLVTAAMNVDANLHLAGR